MLSLEHVSFQNLSSLLYTSEIHFTILNILNKYKYILQDTIFNIRHSFKYTYHL